MKLTNPTKGKVTIKKAAPIISLMPGASVPITSDQVNRISVYIKEFGLKVTDETFRRRVVNSPVPIEEIVQGKEEKKEEAEHIITVASSKYTKEKLLEMTPAQLKEVCSGENLLIGGNRQLLLNRLYKRFGFIEEKQNE